MREYKQTIAICQAICQTYSLEEPNSKYIYTPKKSRTDLAVIEVMLLKKCSLQDDLNIN